MNTTNFETDKTPIAPAVAELEVGESIGFPMERTIVVRNTVSSRSLEWGKEFTVSLDRERGIVTVTRSK